LRDTAGQLTPNQSRALKVAIYNEACAYATNGDTEKALASLRESIELGFAGFTKAKTDPDFFTFRNNPEFVALFDSTHQDRSPGSRGQLPSGVNQAAARQALWEMNSQGAVYGVDVSPDGSLIAASGTIVAAGPAGIVRLIDVETGNVIRTLKGHRSRISSVAFSPDGKRILTGSWDRTMRLWDVQTGEQLESFVGHKWPVLTVAFSPDGKQALSGSDGIRLWDLKTREVLQSFTDHSRTVWSVRFSPDGTKGLSGSWDETVRLWDLSTGKEIRQFHVPSGQVKCVRFSPDGRFAAACATSDGVVRLWNVTSGELIQEFIGHSAGVASIAFSPDGRLLLSSGGQQSANGGFNSPPSDSSIRLWKTETGEQIDAYTGHDECVPSVAFHPDGLRAVSGSADASVRLWKLATY